MISKKLLRKAYDKGLVRICQEPDSLILSCRIGENWFYFGGMLIEEYDDPEKYVKDVGKGNVLNEIFSVLESFRKMGKVLRDGGLLEEYRYYEAYLKERIEKGLVAE